MPRIIISGYGLISPLGAGAWATFSSLLAGRSIADRCESLPDNIEAVDLVRAVGGVSLAQHTATDVSIELAERAAREAIFMSSATGVPGHENTGLGMEAIIGASKGAVHALADVTQRHLYKSGAVQSRPYTSYESTGRPASLTPAPPIDIALAVALGPHGYLSHHLQKRLALGHVTSTVAACASSLLAVHQARMRLLHDDDAPREVLVVTSEAALIAAFVHSYQRLGVLPPLTTQGYRGRPLDRRRAGFLLAEVGAAVVLRRIADDAPLPAGTIELVDTATAADGYDLVQPDREMPGLRRVARQLIGGKRVDLLHPHATGTHDHDPAELAVYADILSDPSSADVYAAKGALGHGLGSAGLASLVLACLCARAKRRPPMPWLDEPIDTPLALRRLAGPPRAITSQAVFAAGFAGHVAGALIHTR